MGAPWTEDADKFLAYLDAEPLDPADITPADHDGSPSRGLVIAFVGCAAFWILLLACLKVGIAWHGTP